MNKISLLETFQVLDHFQQHTGFTVSYDKTQVLRIGSLKDSEARIHTSKEVKWTNGPICVLGVNICANNNMLLTLNYEQYVEKTKAILNNWCNRNLSLIAKINVVNVLIGSLFVYKMSVLPSIPESIVKKIEKVITEFIWSKKKAKIPLRTLQANKASGGLGLINLHIRDQAIKISWIKTMLQDDKYAKLAYLMLSPEMGNLIWKCNLNVPDAKRVTTNTFWSDVLSAWAKINYVQRVEYDDIIWLYSNIRIENKPIFWQKQFGRGLIYVSQLFSGQEPITVEKANQEFGLTFLEYYGLLAALPAEYVKLHRSNIRPSVGQCLYDKFVSSGNISRLAYDILSKEENIICTGKYLHGKKNWARKLSMTLFAGV